MKLIKKIGKKIIYVVKSLNFKFHFKSENEIGLKESLTYLNNIRPDKNGSYKCENEIAKNPEYDLQIIVPAYNVEKYIDECINSLINQKTQYKYLIVIINDGSTDRTFEFIQKYSNISNIIVYNQENKGHSGARNVGLKTINAKYISFVDSDDAVSKNYVENIMSTIYQHNLDGLSFNLTTHKSHLSNDKKKNTIKLIEPENMSKYPCGNVYKSIFWKNIKFPDNYLFEDTIMLLINPFLSNIGYLNQNLYYYRQNQSSISHTFQKSLGGIDSTYVTNKIFSEFVLQKKYLKKLIFRQVVCNLNRCQNYSYDIKKHIFFVNKNFLLACKDTIKIPVVFERNKINSAFLKARYLNKL